MAGRLKVLIPNRDVKPPETIGCARNVSAWLCPAVERAMTGRSGDVNSRSYGRIDRGMACAAYEKVLTSMIGPGG